MTQNTSINARTSISFAQRRRDFLLILAIIALTLSFGGALAQFLISLTQPIRIIGLVGVGALAGLSLVTFIWGQSGRVDEATYLLLGTLAAIFIAPLSTQFIQVLLGALLVFMYLGRMLNAFYFRAPTHERMLAVREAPASMLGPVLLLAVLCVLGGLQGRWPVRLIEPAVVRLLGGG